MLASMEQLRIEGPVDALEAFQGVLCGSATGNHDQPLGREQPIESNRVNRLSARNLKGC